MKELRCSNFNMCFNMVKVAKDFKYIYCCDGFGCSCNSAMTNPRFCADCIVNYKLREDINDQ